MKTPVALFALVLALLAIPTAASASTPCWKDVIADWSKDNAVDGRYSPTCLRQAMVNAPTDLKIYSSLEDDLQSALRARSARRLAGVPARPAAASLAEPSGSSAVSPLVVVLGGLGVLAVVGTGLLVVRRRRA